jgi:hypothetical protein
MTRRSTLLALSVGLITLIAAGCGRDDFENDPRPPVPAEITVKIGDGNVAVSPSEFGAGLANFTIANFEDEPAVLTIEGPIDAVSDEISPNGSAQLKIELEPGDYEASADDVGVVPFSFTVGPERESGQNDLLLP